MLLESYSKEFFRSKCQSGAMRIHCYAHLNNDVGEALPYLNAVLGGFKYIENPPSVTFKISGKLITVHARKIAINAIVDESEAEKIISWLQTEINEAWENRDEIKPSFISAPQPVLLEILKLLPKSNCKACHEATCMVFAAKVTEGAKDHNDCPSLEPENKNRLKEYLSQFNFD